MVTGPAEAAARAVAGAARAEKLRPQEVVRAAASHESAGAANLALLFLKYDRSEGAFCPPQRSSCSRALTWGRVGFKLLLSCCCLVLLLSCLVAFRRVGRGWVAGVPAPSLVAVARGLEHFAFGRRLWLVF